MERRLFLSIFLHLFAFDTKRVDGISNEDVANNLKAMGIIRSAKVKAAMMAIDRADFVDEQQTIYKDLAKVMPYGSVVPSPSMAAFILESLEKNLEDGAVVLDVGSGSGYTTTLLAHMVGKDGLVFGIDKSEDMKVIGEKNIRKAHANYLREERVQFLVGDGREEDPDGEYDYDVIHVGGASTQPQTQENLIRQLKPGGRLIIPIAANDGSNLVLIDKDSQTEEVTKKTVLVGVEFPLLTDIDSPAQKKANTTLGVGGKTRTRGVGDPGGNGLRDKTGIKFGKQSNNTVKVNVPTRTNKSTTKKKNSKSKPTAARPEYDYEEEVGAKDDYEDLKRQRRVFLEEGIEPEEVASDSEGVHKEKVRRSQRQADESDKVNIDEARDFLE